MKKYVKEVTTNLNLSDLCESLTIDKYESQGVLILKISIIEKYFNLHSNSADFRDWRVSLMVDPDHSLGEDIMQGAKSISIKLKDSSLIQGTVYVESVFGTDNYIEFSLIGSGELTIDNGSIEVS